MKFAAAKGRRKNFAQNNQKKMNKNCKNQQQKHKKKTKKKPAKFFIQNLSLSFHKIIFLNPSFLDARVLYDYYTTPKMAAPPAAGSAKRGEQKYVSSSGTTARRRPLFRATIFADFFWGILNTLVAFFRTLVSLDQSQKYGTKPGDVGSGAHGRRPNNDNNNNNGTRRYGGGGSNIHGIDHNATPPSA